MSRKPKTIPEEGIEIMGPAWAAFVEWAINAPQFVAEWERSAGRKMAGPPTSASDAAIDRATGYDKARQKDFEDFTIWVTDTYWGRDEAPAKMREKIDEWRRHGGHGSR